MVMNIASWRCCVTCVALLFSTVIVVYAIVLSLAPTDNTTSHKFPHSGARATSSLRFVVAVTRHGNRGPLMSYPNDPYPASNTTYWPYGVGELTLHGRLMMFRVGILVTYLYMGYLNRSYYSNDFQAYSTVNDRTLMSGEEFLAGLYPPIGFQLWNRSILWQPVPVFPTYLDHSTLVTEPSLCPQFKAAQTKSLLEFGEKYSSNISAIVGYLNQYTGLKNASYLTTLFSTWESFFCADNEGLTLPDWAMEVYPQPMAALMAKVYVAYTITSDVMIRLLQGQLFQEIIGLMEGKINGTINRQMYYFSAHDYTILGLKGILGLTDSIDYVVNTGSVLLYELHEDPKTNNYYVQVLYIDGNSTTWEPVLLNIRGCNDPCYFDNFMNLTQKYYNITDYTSECQTSS